VLLSHKSIKNNVMNVDTQFVCLITTTTTTTTTTTIIIIMSFSAVCSSCEVEA
jgi:transcription elongation factor Elf1